MSYLEIIFGVLWHRNFFARETIAMNEGTVEMIEKNIIIVGYCEDYKTGRIVKLRTNFVQH